MAKVNNNESQNRVKSNVKKDNFFKRPKANYKQAFRSFAKRGNNEEFKKRSNNEAFKKRDNSESLKPNYSSTSDDFFVKKVDPVASPTSTGTRNFRQQPKKGGGFFKKTKNEHSGTNTEEGKEKKPFDKKKWRLQKYSKKYKLQQWEENHKKTVMREYYKQTKHEQPPIDVRKIYEEEENENHSDNASDQEGATSSAGSVNTKQSDKKRPFRSIRDRFLQAKEEKEDRRAAAEKRKAEKEAALRAYKKKKLEKYKKLNQRTRKGQPIMKHRIDMLLEQIQQSVA